MSVKREIQRKEKYSAGRSVKTSISLSEVVNSWAEEQAAKRGFDNFSAYIADLIRREKERQVVETGLAHVLGTLLGRAVLWLLFILPLVNRLNWILKELRILNRHLNPPPARPRTLEEFANKE